MTTGFAQEAVDPEPAPVGATAMSPAHAVLRDIVRGGLAGLIVGVALAGIGGRLVMRLAAAAVPEAAGFVTENGNVVGMVTPGGTAALVLGIGLLFGAMAGSIWVVVHPWLPAGTAARTLVSIPIALAFGTLGLVNERNPDFALLGRDPAIVASLVILVALFGPALVLVDGWLERHLPRPRSDDHAVIVAYSVVTVVGLVLTFGLMVPIILGSDLAAAGLALLVVGVATLLAWRGRLTGRDHPDPRLLLVARFALAVAVTAGLAVSARHVAGALGLG